MSHSYVSLAETKAMSRKRQSRKVHPCARPRSVTAVRDATLRWHTEVMAATVPEVTMLTVSTLEVLAADNLNTPSAPQATAPRPGKLASAATPKRRHGVWCQFKQCVRNIRRN